MRERDAVLALLKHLDRPADPRPEFADALRTRLLAELPEANGARAWLGMPGPRLALPARRRRPVLVGAVAIAVVAAVIATVVLSRPTQASAVDVIKQARLALTKSTPFKATLRFDFNPDGSNQDKLVPKGATATVAVRYGGPTHMRTQIVAKQPPFGVRGVGAYDVFDGKTIGSYDPARNEFHSFPAPKEFRPLGFLSLRGG